MTATAKYNFDTYWPYYDYDYTPADVAHSIPRHERSTIRTTPSLGTFWRPSTDVYETDDELVIHVDLPGVPKSEIKLESEEGQIVVHGNHKAPIEAATSRVRERQIGSFRKVVKIPEEMDTSKTTAKYENGLLEITVPKRDNVSSSRRKIEIN
ncbi:Heat shock 70 kDa protein 1A [Nowakowskiella sp. JEL0407]|nr:Heat shock 70 kDa protein 1A [Nowakowskiella sp. JEL0407]